MSPSRPLAATIGIALFIAGLAGGGCNDHTAPPAVLGPDPVTVFRLTTNPSNERAAAWSPNGGQLAFASDRSGSFNLYVRDLASGNDQRLTQSSADHSFPSWSPGGDRIVFDSTENRDLYIVAADGDTVYPFFIAPASEELAPAWSSEANRIAFASNAVGGNYNIFIGTVDRDSLITVTSSFAEEGDPAWSPDGTRIAFRSTELFGDRNIWIVDLRDSTVSVVSPQGGDDVRPAWSPDGNFLAWASDRSGNREIWAIDLRGGAPVEITLNSANDTAPAWSPDGKTIAFTSDRSGNFDIWLATGLDSVLATSRARAAGPPNESAFR